ncbi:hypothetical protein BJ741DRAFT_612289 [Chytriomyces cf. hyalinus JEL632]|nr:hypothetical protein BJ741DRAFT_612289 [Chytriomyces cf. hyalinus JEL632]
MTTPYTIVSGDTCYEIARRNGMSLDELYGLNPGLSQHVYDLQIGSTIQVRCSSGQGQQTQQHFAPPASQPPQSHYAAPPSQPAQSHFAEPQSAPAQPEKIPEKNFFEQNGLKIAGGVLGAAAVLGVGAFAMHEWRETKKVSNTQAPAFASYNTNHGPLTWIKVTGKKDPLPQNAVQLGRDTDGAPLYAGRAPYEGGWQVGKVRDSDFYFSYGGKEIAFEGGFEVLCGTAHGITVVPQVGTLNLASITNQPIDAGHESNGDRLYLAVCEHRGGMQVGKCGPRIAQGAAFGLDGKEHFSPQYRVVVIA